MHFLLALLFSTQLLASDIYPSTWWTPVDDSDRRSWEILPQDAQEGEVILSKRTELGVFSNLSYAPFTLWGEKYASVEGLWQMMKYPDATDPTDERNLWEGYSFNRDQVKKMYGFDCKRAGDQANRLMRENDLNWISFKKHKFNYKDLDSGSAFHYQLMYKAIKAKVMQNSKIKKLLIKTGDLILRPDHKIKSTKPASYFYNKILMKIRSEIQD